MTHAKSLFTIKPLYLFFIAITAFFLFMYGNQNYTLFDNSETHYARVTQEMVNSGNHLTLTFNHENWYVHPPLYFWIASTIAPIFNWGEFTLRFQEGFFGFLSLLIVFLMANYFFNEKTAFLSTLLLASSFYFFIFSRFAIFDNHLLFFMLLSLYLFFLAFYEDNHQGYYLAGAAIATALAVLSKGPIGLIQQGMFILPFLIYKKRLSFLFNKKFLFAAVLFFAIASPWYIYQLLINGQPFFNVALKDYTWYRFFGVVENQAGAWYYYFPLLLTFFPWIFYLPLAITQSFRDKIWQGKHKLQDFSLFAWFAMVVTFAFFSAAQTKLPNYIVLIYPFLSILTAHCLLSLKIKWARLLGVVIPILTAVLFIGSYFMQLSFTKDLIYRDTIYLQIFFLLPFLMSLAYYLTLLYSNIVKAVYVYLFGTIIFVFFTVHIILPQTERYKDSKIIVTTIKQQHIPTKNYSVINYKGFSPYIMFYLNKNTPYPETPENLTALLAKTPAPVFIITPKEEAAAIKANFPQMQLLKITYNKCLYLVKPTPPDVL